MKQKTPIWLVLAGAVLFAILFHNKPAGINQLIFNAFIIGSLIWMGRINKNNFHHMVLSVTTLITLAASFFLHSTLAIVMNYVSLILLSTAALFPETRALHRLTGISFLNIGYSMAEFFPRLFNGEDKTKPVRKFGKTLAIVGIPAILVIIFIVIYRTANPWFDDAVGGVFTSINSFLINVFGTIDWAWFWTFLGGLLFAIWLLMGKAHPGIVKSELQKTDILFRRRAKYTYRGKKTALRTEYKSAIVLLVAMNIILLLVNFLDINNVWFGFEWQGETLKQFVHEGTWLLILSILLSIGIILFYFRKNLNFLQNNKALKILAYAWMAQNAILAISVAIRNLHYIEYFNLAYKRIAVFFFLLAVLVGLLTVILKIHKARTSFFLLRYNSLSVFVILIAMSLVNWDVCIAKYNFSHADKAFVHLDFLKKLDERALPWLDKDMEYLESLKQRQYQEFDFARDASYITPESYYSYIQERKERFIEDFESRHWLSWNPADQKAYDLLTKSQND
ncbi:MAG: DUF4173 domain-containing protein [Bacteroidales bacterium]